MRHPQGFRTRRRAHLCELSFACGQGPAWPPYPRHPSAHARFACRAPWRALARSARDGPPWAPSLVPSVPSRRGRTTRARCHRVVFDVARSCAPRTGAGRRGASRMRQPGRTPRRARAQHIPCRLADRAYRAPRSRPSRIRIVCIPQTTRHLLSMARFLRWAFGPRGPQGRLISRSLVTI